MVNRFIHQQLDLYADNLREIDRYIEHFRITELKAIRKAQKKDLEKLLDKEEKNG